MRVSVAGLNLDTAADAQRALSRIRWSAGVFCDAGPGRQSLERQATVDRCTAQMVRKAADQLHAPLLTALLEARPLTETPVALAQK